MNEVSSSINVETSTNVSGSLNTEVITTTAPTTPVLTGRAKSNANLRMYPKGVSGRSQGKAKGTVDLKPAIDRALNKQRVEAFANNFVEQAISGSTRKAEILLKLGGALSDSPQVNVQQNNITITPEILKAVDAFLKDKGVVDA